MKIHLHMGNEEKGPFSEAQVRAMYLAGNVNADTLYWYEGLIEWQPIDHFFAKEIAFPPPAPPPLAAMPQIAQPKVASPRVRYNPHTDTFTGDIPTLVRLAMRAIQVLGWKLDNANESLGFVTFETGISWGSWSGVSCSLQIAESSPGNFRVTGTGKQNIRGAQLAAIDFGESKRRAQKAIDAMKDLAR